MRQLLLVLLTTLIHIQASAQSNDPLVEMNRLINNTSGKIYAARLKLETAKNKNSLSNCILACKELAAVYRTLRHPELITADSLFLYYAGQTKEQPIIFEALQLLITDLLNNNQPQLTDRYFEKAEGLISSDSSYYRRAVYYQLKGIYYFKKFNPQKAIPQFESSIQYGTLAAKNALVARSLAQLGFAWAHRMKTDSAALYLNKALYLNEKFSPPEDIAFTYDALGFLYRSAGNYDKSVECYQRAINYYVKAGNPVRVAFSYLTMGETEIGRKIPTAASPYLRHARLLFERLAYKQGLAVCYSLLGRYHAQMNQKDSATLYMQMAKMVLPADNNAAGLYVNGQNAVSMLESGNSKKADSLLKKVYQEAGRLLHPEMVEKAFNKTDPDTYNQQPNRLTEASVFSGRSINRPPDSVELINPFTGYQHKKDSQINALLKANQALIEAAEHTKRKQIADSLAGERKNVLLVKTELKVKNLSLVITLLLLTAAILLIAGIWYSRKRINLEKKFTLHYAEKNLMLINGHIDTIKDRSAAKKDFILLKEKIAPLTRLYERIRESMSEKVFMQEYLADLCGDVVTSYAIHTPVHLLVEAPVYLPGAKAQTVGFLVNEIVTNSIRHAFKNMAAGQVYVSCFKTGKKFTLTIRDNGSGYDNQLITPGTGTENIEGFTQELSAKMNMKTDNGTTFEFIFI